LLYIIYLVDQMHKFHYFSI